MTEHEAASAARWLAAERVFKIVGTLGVLFGIGFGIYTMGQPARQTGDKQLSDLIGYRNLALMAFQVAEWALVCGIDRGTVPVDEIRFKAAYNALDAIKLSEVAPPTLTRHFVHIRHLTERAQGYAARGAGAELKADFLETVNELKDSLLKVDVHLIGTKTVEFDGECFAHRGREAQANDRCIGYWMYFVPGTTDTSKLKCRLIGAPGGG